MNEEQREKWLEMYARKVCPHILKDETFKDFVREIFKEFTADIQPGNSDVHDSEDTESGEEEEKVPFPHTFSSETIFPVVKRLRDTFEHMTIGNIYRMVMRDSIFQDLNLIEENALKLCSESIRRQDQIILLEGVIKENKRSIKAIESNLENVLEINEKQKTRIAELEMKLQSWPSNSSSPTENASTHTHCQTAPVQTMCAPLIWPSNEKHPPHERYNRETGGLHIPETSHCTACGSFQGISIHAHISSHQTSNVKASFEQLLCQIPVKVLGLHENLNLNAGRHPIEFSLLSALSLECHVGLRGHHIHIQLLDGNHPERVHSEITLLLNSRSN